MVIKKQYNKEPVAITLAKQDFSKGVERDLFYLVINQLKTGFNIQKNIYDNLEIYIPFSWLKETNYRRMRGVIDSMQNKKLRFIDNKNMEYDSIVPFPRMRCNKHGITVTLFNEITPQFLELSKGYSKYSIDVIRSYKSDYTQRFYEILSGKKSMNKGVWGPVDVNYLKNILNAENYTNTGNFMQKVIYVAKKEMDQKGDITFEVEKIKSGRWITHLIFTIYHNTNEDKFREALDSEINYINSLDSVQKTQLISKLINKYKFTKQQQTTILTKEGLLDKFYEIDNKIENGLIEITDDKSKYMAASLGFK